MHPYHDQGIKWSLWLSSLSDEELIEKHNTAVGGRYFGLARQMYLGCLQHELLSRNFESSILFNRDSNGKVTSYSLAVKVEIREIDGAKVLIPTHIVG